MPTATMPITGDPAADELLVTDPLALVIGMLLDQQVPMEWAFRGPATLRDRLGRLDCAAIASMPPEQLEAVFKEKPALHRYPASMAKRTHALCVHIVEHYDADAAKIWKGVRDPAELFSRIRALPGVRRGEGEDLSRHPGQAAQGRAEGLGGLRGAVLRLGTPLGRRHRFPREPRARPRLEAGAEGQGEVEGRVAPGATAATNQARRCARTAAQSCPSGSPAHASLRSTASGGTCHADAPAWITSSVKRPARVVLHPASADDRRHHRRGRRVVEHAAVEPGDDGEGDPDHAWRRRAHAGVERNDRRLTHTGQRARHQPVQRRRLVDDRSEERRVRRDVDRRQAAERPRQTLQLELPEHPPPLGVRRWVVDATGVDQRADEHEVPDRSMRRARDVRLGEQCSLALGDERERPSRSRGDTRRPARRARARAHGATDGCRRGRRATDDRRPCRGTRSVAVAPGGCTDCDGTPSHSVLNPVTTSNGPSVLAPAADAGWAPLGGCAGGRRGEPGRGGS